MGGPLRFSWSAAVGAGRGLLNERWMMPTTDAALGGVVAVTPSRNEVAVASLVRVASTPAYSGELGGLALVSLGARVEGDVRVGRVLGAAPVEIEMGTALSGVVSGWVSASTPL